MRNCGALVGMLAALSLGLICVSQQAGAADTASSESGLPEKWSLHGQVTFVDQYHPAFRSPYRGANSLDPGSRSDETFDATLFAGARLWEGGEVYVNPEIDQGFGLSNTIGAAGFPSGEAYKVGQSTPYFRLQRLFIRQTFDLGGDAVNIEADANQLGGSRTSNNIVITAGKFSVTDIFDTNIYAHDPKNDFLNWSLIDAGAFDYAADAWGYSYGIAGEWTQNWWTLRAGLFNLSRIPNSTQLETDFSQFELVAEGGERRTFWGMPGTVKLLVFVNRGRMGSYDNAIALSQLTGRPPDTSLVHRYASRPGGSLNIEQKITGTLGVFARASLNDGSKEAYEFTEINRSLSMGLSLRGAGWGAPNDTVGVAWAVNSLSNSARRYFADGGLGILIGDGQLARYGTEQIVEAYYAAALTDWLTASADYQFIANPAYNHDRGPVSILGARLHAQF